MAKKFGLALGGDEFSPAEITLSSDLVSKIQTSETDPKVIFDSAGLRAENATGQLTFNLDAATGNASFNGYVHASKGLDLDASTGVGTPPDIDRIRWIRQSDGSVVADLVAQSNAGGEVSRYYAYERGAAGSQVEVTATNAALNRYGSLFISQLAGGLGDISAVVSPAGGGAVSKKFLRGDGTSDFAFKSPVRIYLPMSNVAGPVTPAISKSGTFTPAGGTCWAIYSATGHANPTGFYNWLWKLDGVNQYIEGMWAQSGNDHMTFPIGVQNLGALTAGHLYTVSVFSNNAELTGDANDRYTCAIIELMPN